MNNTSKYLLFFLSGLIFGILLVSVLSYRASNTHLVIIQSAYERQQEVAAMQAMKKHNYFLAVHHYKNIVDLSANPANIFQESKKIWTWSFPFASEIMIRIKAHLAWQETGGERGNGIYHGRMAYALEKYDMHDEAKTEWQKAMQMLEMMSVEQVKNFIEKM
jgi:hypothetical protein